MEMKSLILPIIGLIAMLVLTIGNAIYRQKTGSQRLSISLISWLNLLIVFAVIGFSGYIPAKTALPLLGTGAIVSGVYLILIRPRIYRH